MKNNYYTIHKNKKPKKITQRKGDPFKAIEIITMVIGAAQVGLQSTMAIPKYKEGGVKSFYGGQNKELIWQPSKKEFISPDGKVVEVEAKTPKDEKRLQIIQTVSNTAKAIAFDIPKQRMLHKFKTTGRYVK